MKIVVDENVPYGREAFETLGEVETAPGRAISRAMLDGADALVVRSITKVNAELLDGTPVRFVGTCTIGEDHIDKPYLAGRNIAFTSAPGCNANSVGEYMVSAMLHLAKRHGFVLREKTLGIVGVGNVGGNLHQKARALGMQCVLNDPPLEAQTGDGKYRPISEILDCDLISLHVPLEKSGPHATWHLADVDFLRWLKPSAIVMNASRGAVADNAALRSALKEGRIQAAVLDVWEGEPEPDMELLELVDFATPHIAGYSFDGKVNGTRQVYEAACRHFGAAASWNAQASLPAPETPSLRLDGQDPDALAEAVHGVYDIAADDAAMRSMISEPAEKRGAIFDGLRKNYPRRREFFNTSVSIDPPNSALAQTLAGLGFRVTQD